MAPLAPISQASSIIGFISFAFTFFTFLRVFWSSLQTMTSAPRQVRAYLDNLRSELYDEREYFRSAMRDVRSKSRSNPRQRVNCAPVRLMNDSVKGLLQTFRRLEAPFVEERFWDEEADLEKYGGDDRPLGDGAAAAAGGGGGGAGLGRRARGGGSGHSHGESVYSPMTFARRWDWLRSKDDVITLADQVTRIQTRRIAFDTNNVLQALHHMERQMRDFDDRLFGLEEAVMGETLSDGNVYVKRKKSDK